MIINHIYLYYKLQYLLVILIQTNNNHQKGLKLVKGLISSSKLN